MVLPGATLVPEAGSLDLVSVQAGVTCDVVRHASAGSTTARATAAAAATSGAVVPAGSAAARATTATAAASGSAPDVDDVSSVGVDPAGSSGSTHGSAPGAVTTLVSVTPYAPSLT